MTIICPTCEWENEGGTFCESCRTNLVTGEPPEPAASEAEPEPEPSTDPGPGGDAPRLVLVMSAARTQYERMVDDDQREQLPFPEDFESRRFEPTSKLVTVGRISPGKPADVDIALTGDTADPGISHYQCLFEADGEGWMVQDGNRTEGSTNGTFVNDRTESLGPTETFRLNDGDRIYFGAWTCFTVSLPPA